ncbi:MAG: protein-glutamate methylesterase/protein-glutamine glutaminase [Acidimicrobiales bacterium]
MGARARVLIADDAVVVRRLVSDVLSAVPTIDVVGTAANGRLALAKIPQVSPDIVILDVEMPDMDGIETLTSIRAEYPRLPVIMFSTLTERGAAITLEALMRGANDYVTKPANVGSVSEAMERVRSELVPRIHGLCGITPVGAASTEPVTARRPRVAARPVRPTVPGGRVDAVVVGISTGGPSALADIIPALPSDLGVPVFIVQHMPPMFTRLLAERLDRTTPISVTEAGGGEPAVAGTCLIAPGDRHMVVARGASGDVVAALNDGPRENSCRPAVDVLFRSAAEVYGPHLLGVVMTGMGQDGLRGSDDIVAAGGSVVVQDEATSVVWGMPGAVAQAGLANAVVPLSQIPGEIARRVAAGRSATRPVAGVTR